MKNIIIILLITTSFALNAQVEFKASISKDAVMIGEPFKLEYKISEKFDKFTLGEFESFEVISGPSTSMQQSINITNGEMVKIISVTYTYYIRAINTNNNKIQAAEIEINNKKFTTNEIEVIIIDAEYINPKEDKVKDIKGTSRL